MPALIIILTIILDNVLDEASLFSPKFGDNQCFFGSFQARFIYFHVIIAIILVINLLFFLASAYNLLFGVWAANRDDQSHQSGAFQVKLELGDEQGFLEGFGKI